MFLNNVIFVIFFVFFWRLENIVNNAVFRQVTQKIVKISRNFGNLTKITKKIQTKTAFHNYKTTKNQHKTEQIPEILLTPIG